MNYQTAVFAHASGFVSEFGSANVSGSGSGFAWLMKVQRGRFFVVVARIGRTWLGFDAGGSRRSRGEDCNGSQDDRARRVIVRGIEA